MLTTGIFESNIKNNWLIRQFETYRFNGVSITDKFIPRPYVSVIFHFGDRPFFKGDISLHLEPFFVAPIVPKAFLLEFKGNMDTLAITIKATVFSRLFRLDLSPVHKQSIPLPHEIFHPVWETMSKMNISSDRCNHFSDFINSFHPGPYLPDAVDLLYDKILEKSISTPLKDILPECFSSKSTILRKFIKRSGVTPKMLMRIVRLNYLWMKIHDEKSIDYQELVFAGNYFDQSHFINDFKTIIGETPSYFFNRNLEIVKKYSAKPSGKKI